ncbi:hypothetical protein E4U13_005118 [Claviceps humidiphila]|uniref:Uncharacterized protein n=1 Tax=Claviceps humidiphila TaxID=1294629 RepID=A0A9P7TSP9_9HYPO|nr:hypothetical protein E4U13_005118 [Claviceps humidiphila]
MKSNTLSMIIILYFLSLLASVSAVAIPESITDLFVPSWNVAIEPGQEVEIVVNGTVQQVDAYMEANYPGWSAKWANFTSKSAPAKRAPSTRPVSSRPELMKVKSIMCEAPLPACLTGAILGGIDYLRKIRKGRHPRNGPGPRNCGKVSCSDNSAIFWCNDTDQPKILDSFSDIALGAEIVAYQCGMNGYDTTVSGQVFLFGDYSVIVGQSNCDD